jgi:hypothetical protein
MLLPTSLNIFSNSGNCASTSANSAFLAASFCSSASRLIRMLDLTPSLNCKTHIFNKAFTAQESGFSSAAFLILPYELFSLSSLYSESSRSESPSFLKSDE